MGKWDENKKLKQLSLLDTGFRLFTTQGMENTSISDIVKQAGVAKGTFYLYFHDKYDLRNKLIAHRASIIFQKAVTALGDRVLPFEEKLWFIVDHILDQLNENKSLLGLIHKNLSWAIFKNALINDTEAGDTDFREAYYEMISGQGVTLRDPEVMLFLIIELISSTSYSAILYEEPVTIEALKPFLKQTIYSIIQSHIISPQEV